MYIFKFVCIFVAGIIYLYTNSDFFVVDGIRYFFLTITPQWTHDTDRSKLSSEPLRVLRFTLLSYVWLFCFCLFFSVWHHVYSTCLMTICLMKYLMLILSNEPNARRRRSGWVLNMALDAGAGRLLMTLLYADVAWMLHYLNADGLLCNKWFPNTWSLPLYTVNFLLCFYMLYIVQMNK